MKNPFLDIKKGDEVVVRVDENTLRKGYVESVTENHFDIQVLGPDSSRSPIVAIKKENGGQVDGDMYIKHNRGNLLPKFGFLYTWEQLDLLNKPLPEGRRIKKKVNQLVNNLLATHGHSCALNFFTEAELDALLEKFN